jgi:hypothetical protein
MRKGWIFFWLAVAVSGAYHWYGSKHKQQAAAANPPPKPVAQVSKTPRPSYYYKVGVEKVYVEDKLGSEYVLHVLLKNKGSGPVTNVTYTIQPYGAYLDDPCEYGYPREYSDPIWHLKVTVSADRIEPGEQVDLTAKFQRHYEFQPLYPSVEDCWPVLKYDKAP